MNTYWRHVVWCANKCFGKARFTTKHTCQAEIAEFHIHVAVKENVSRLQISVKYNSTIFVSIVTFSQSQHNLVTNLPNKIFIDGLPTNQ